MLTIYKREVSAYFKSPVAYSVAGFFMMLVGLYFWINNILNASVNFSTTLNSVSMYLTFITPIITMRLLADEKRNGTEVLLRTSPISITGIVIGKFFAAFTLFITMVALTLIFPIMMNFMVQEGGKIPSAINLGGYVGFILLGATYLSIGLFISSLTESQIVAAVAGVISLLLVYFLQSIGATVGGTIGAILQWISPLSRNSDFAVGSFNFASLFFLISLTALMLFITIISAERKRWN